MYDEAQKQRIYEWRKKNREKYREVQDKAVRKYQEEHWNQKLASAKKYRDAHKEEINQKQRERRNKK